MKLFDVTPEQLAPHVRDGLLQLVASDPVGVDVPVLLRVLLGPGSSDGAACYLWFVRCGGAAASPHREGQALEVATAVFIGWVAAAIL